LLAWVKSTKSQAPKSKQFRIDNIQMTKTISSEARLGHFPFGHWYLVLGILAEVERLESEITRRFYGE